MRLDNATHHNLTYNPISFFVLYLQLNQSVRKENTITNSYVLDDIRIIDGSGCFPDEVKGLAVAVVVSVGKIESSHIHPSKNKSPDLIGRRSGWAYSAYNLGASEFLLAFHVSQNKILDIETPQKYLWGKFRAQGIPGDL